MKGCKECVKIDDNELLKDIRLAMSEDYLNEVHLKYRGRVFSIEPVNGKICVFGEYGEKEFDNVEALFFGFLLAGQPFISCVSEIEYDDV